MCGRYSQTQSVAQLADLFSAVAPQGVPDRLYNIAPTHAAVVITNEIPAHIRLFRWGLVPRWAKDKRPGATFNARIETVAEKPTFAEALRLRRCLVPAEGWFEWRNGEIPYLIKRSDRPLFCFAGLWELNEDLATFTIITRPANQALRHLHDRMPVVLQPQSERAWLNGTLSVADLPAQNDHDLAFVAHSVSLRVNSAKYESADVLLPDTPPEQKRLF